MANRNPHTHVRIRSTLLRQWIWELVTSEGHVAAACEPFATRDACEADARRQGLPVTGARRPAAGAEPAQRRPEGDRVYRTTAGIWTWERVEDGRVVATAPVAFLTREECESDLRLFDRKGRAAA